MGKAGEHNRVLGVRPTSRGLAFALFEAPTVPLDWGVKQVRPPKHRAYERHLIDLISFCEPDAVVIQIPKTAKPSSSGQRRIEDLVKAVSQRGVRVVRYSRDDVRDVFGQFGSRTKFEIAQTITRWLPEFRAFRLRYRKPWMSEDYCMAIFDSIALVLACYYLNE
jgi:hypothetical protein